VIGCTGAVLLRDIIDGETWKPTCPARVAFLGISGACSGQAHRTEPAGDLAEAQAIAWNEESPLRME